MSFMAKKASPPPTPPKAPGVTAQELREELQLFAKKTLETELDRISLRIVDELRPLIMERRRSAREEEEEEEESEAGANENFASEGMTSTSIKPLVLLRRSPTGSLAAPAARRAKRRAYTSGTCSSETLKDGTASQPFAPLLPLSPPKAAESSVGSPRLPEQQISWAPPAEQENPLAMTDEARALIAGRDETEGQPHWFVAFVHSPSFKLFFLSMVFVNAIAVGLETDYMARHWTKDVPVLFRILDVVFCVVFVFEIAAMLYADGWRFFWNQDMGGNWFDLGVVILQIGELIAGIVFKAEPSDISGILRILRLTRVSRIARIFKHVSSLRKLIISIVHSCKCLIWPMLMILVVTYLYGVFFTQIVTEHKMRMNEEELKEQEDLQEYYGTLSVAMLSLFQTISEGVHWKEVMEPLVVHCSPWLTIVFVLYIGFVLFAMMNVITAFFVESAMVAAADEHKECLLRQLWETFDQTNEEVTEDVFNKHLDAPQMREWLKVLDLEPEQARQSGLFQILDIDGSGSVDVDELVVGCTRLAGNAKALELASFMNGYQQEVMRAQEFRQMVEASLNSITQKLDKRKR